MFSKQGLFQDGWKAVYGDMIEWVPLSKDGKITQAIPGELTVVSEFGQRHKGAVVNVIPPQFAGAIARNSGLANTTGWCPVNPTTFESTLVKDVYVLGDASIAGAMPKSRLRRQQPGQGGGDVRHQCAQRPRNGGADLRQHLLQPRGTRITASPLRTSSASPTRALSPPPTPAA